MIFLLYVVRREMHPYKLYLLTLTHCVTALKAISWASGVELNYIKKR